MAVWVTIENGEITGYYDLLPSSWRNVSGLDKSISDLPFLKTLGWFPVVRRPVDYDPATHDIPSFEYQIQQDQVVEIPIVSPKANPTHVPSVEELKANFMAQLREQRNQRLIDCDYTQLVDVQTTMDDSTKAKWFSYRQALRDLPAKYFDNDVLNIEDILWPEV